MTQPPRFDPHTGRPIGPDFVTPDYVRPAGLHVPEADPEARTWGMAGHLSALAFFVIPAAGHIVGPLVVWLVKRDATPFAGDQAREALNFNITWTIVAFAAGILLAPTFCLGIGFILVPTVMGLIYVFTLVMTIAAAIRAHHGEWYRYPLTIRLVK